MATASLPSKSLIIWSNISSLGTQQQRWVPTAGCWPTFTLCYSTRIGAAWNCWLLIAFTLQSSQVDLGGIPRPPTLGPRACTFQSAHQRSHCLNCRVSQCQLQTWMHRSSPPKIIKTLIFYMKNASVIFFSPEGMLTSKRGVFYVFFFQSTPCHWKH